MKHFKTTLLLLLISQSVFSQKNEDYFLKIIDTTKNKELKLASLDSLIYNTNRQKNLDNFADRTEQYVDLAIELERYEDAINFSIRGFYNINNRLNQKERALKLIEKVEKHKDKTNNSFLIGSIYLKKGGAYSSTKDYEKAKDNFTLAINSFKDIKKDSIYKADALLFRGHEYFDTGDYLKAIEDYQLASKYYEDVGDTQYMFYALASIINIYGANGFNQKTIDEREKLIQKKLSKKFTNGLFTDYYNQSINYRKLDSINKQEEYLLKAYSLLKSDTKDRNNINDNNVLILTSTLSSFYSTQNNLSLAKKHLDEAKTIYNKLDRNSMYSFVYLKANANYLVGLKKYNEALKLAKQSSLAAKKSGVVSAIMDGEKLLSEIYIKTGQSNKALTSYTNYTKIKDSIFTATKTNSLLYYQSLYETERKEKEIQKQQAAIDSLAKENETKQRLLLFGGIGLALLFSTIVLYRNRIRLKREKEKQEEFSQKLLLSQEEERKRISKDLHDSLGQSLLLIKNKVSLKSDDKTKELVNNAIEEMRSISRVLHPFQLEDIGISKALENLIIQLDESYENTYIFGDIDDIKSLLNPQQEVNLFRIIQECLSNIIKHAKADSAKVILINDKKSITISIKDNGVGFDFSEKYNDFRSLGLKTIKERVKFLKGSLKIDSVKNQGTTFNIIFPVK
ncbi:ATP-binding protein [Polaribacter uvawellassae]|uniref:ATP-binding protein n=1 Tax=Polaribacter uvawellassae TaxID=3133495 RepID=UPI00321A249D